MFKSWWLERGLGWVMQWINGAKAWLLLCILDILHILGILFLTLGTEIHLRYSVSCRNQTTRSTSLSYPNACSLKTPDSAQPIRNSMECWIVSMSVWQAKNPPNDSCNIKPNTSVNAATIFPRGWCGNTALIYVPVYLIISMPSLWTEEKHWRWKKNLHWIYEDRDMRCGIIENLVVERC